MCPLPLPPSRKWLQCKCTLIKPQAHSRADFSGPVCNARDLAPVLSWGSYCCPPGNRLPRWRPNSWTGPMSKDLFSCYPHTALPALSFHSPAPSAHTTAFRRGSIHSYAQRHYRGLLCVWGGWPQTAMGNHACSLHLTTNMRAALIKELFSLNFLLCILMPILKHIRGTRKTSHGDQSLHH